jgi:hypothetical protein
MYNIKYLQLHAANEFGDNPITYIQENTVEEP